MRKLWMVCALAIGLAGCVSPPPRGAKLDGGPWPTDSNGNLITGMTMLLILVDYRGVAVEVCVERSSGNEVLDTSAIRRMTTHMYQPEMKQGFPASSYVRVPVYFGKSISNDDWKRPIPANQECRPEPVPGISPAEAALAQQKQFTIFPTAALEVPGVAQAWPRDANRQLASVYAIANVLVDPSGRVVSVENLKPDNYPAFNAVAARTIAKITFPSTDVQHWEAITFYFLAAE
jgi:TonB family protein